MKLATLAACALLAGVQPLSASQQEPATSTASTNATAEQDVIALSKEKWRLMSERNVDALAELFHDDSVFVHMGATMSKTQELDVIKGGGIDYKDVDIQEVSVRFMGTTAILLNRIRLLAIVDGKEVVNPFAVTEVSVQQDGKWTLGSLSFTRLLTPAPWPHCDDRPARRAPGGHPTWPASFRGATLVAPLACEGGMTCLRTKSAETDSGWRCG